MVANLQQSIPSQDFGYKAEQVMVATLNWDSPAIVNIGGLPANAVVTGVQITTVTAFNAGTNNNINVGFTDQVGTTANAYVAAQAIGPIGIAAPALPATAVPLSRPTTVTCAYAPSGTAASAGSARVILRFVVP